MRLPALADWLFRWQKPRDGLTLQLNRKRIYILPSRAGLLYALTLVVMLLGAINYGLSLGHLLVFLLAGLGLVGMVHTYRNLAGLRLSADAPEPVFAGDVAHFPIQLHNPGPLSRSHLLLSAANAPPLRADLAPGGEARIALPLPTSRRGWQRLPRLRLETPYPLGLFTAWSFFHPPQRCLIYPRPHYTPLPPPQASDRHGPRHGQAGEEDFAGLRPRQPADPLRHVDWKAAARRGPQAPLLVKQFAGGEAAVLQLDWQATQADPETRLSQLAGWVLSAEDAGLRYGLSLPGQQLPPDCGPAHRLACLRLLALFGEGQG